jgi:hypothetical protein
MAKGDASRPRRHDRAAAALISAYVRELVIVEDTSSAPAPETAIDHAIVSPVAGNVSGELSAQA